MFDGAFLQCFIQDTKDVETIRNPHALNALMSSRLAALKGGLALVYKSTVWWKDAQVLLSHFHVSNKLQFSRRGQSKIRDAAASKVGQRAEEIKIFRDASDTDWMWRQRRREGEGNSIKGTERVSFSRSTPLHSSSALLYVQGAQQVWEFDLGIPPCHAISASLAAVKHSNQSEQMTVLT